MKKWILALIVIASCILMVSCNKTEPASSTSKTEKNPATTTPAADDHAKVDVDDDDDHDDGKEEAKALCPVSGEELGEDGMEAFSFMYKERKIELCCKNCKKKFDLDPEKYIAIIDGKMPAPEHEEGDDHDDDHDEDNEDTNKKEDDHSGHDH